MGLDVFWLSFGIRGSGCGTAVTTGFRRSQRQKKPLYRNRGFYVFPYKASENELFEFHLAELVQARYEGREMRRLLVRSQRLSVAPRLADHQHVIARSAFEQVIGNAALVLERSRHQFPGRIYHFLAVGIRRTVKTFNRIISLLFKFIRLSRPRRPHRNRVPR